MRTLNLERPSLAEFFSLIESEPGKYRNIFRGQSNAEWNLIPSLYRIKDTGISSNTKKEEYEYAENSFINRFFEEGFSYIPNIGRSFSNDRILAQHFGVPTRLLDWTRDPLVALYFAVDNPDEETDAAVFMILPDAQYRPEDVRSLGPHKVISLHPPAFDRRIPAQKSIFTHHPYGDENKYFVPLDLRADMGNLITTEEGLTRGFCKIIISQRVKMLLHHELNRIGVDRRNLFPGLDGVGSYIASRSRFGIIS